MLDVQRTINNLIGIELTEDFGEFANNVICAFDTTEDNVMVERVNYASVGARVDFRAYTDDSPIINIQVEDNKIVDAWE